MSAKNSNTINARRKLLKGLAVGSGAVIAGKSLPESWSRPVVDAVMLPAHAQTSLSSFSGMTMTAITPNSRFAQLMEGLVSDAQAQVIPEPSFETESCIVENSDGTLMVDAVIYAAIDGELNVLKVNAASVTAGGAPAEMTGINCYADQAGLLDKLGLISNANAGLSVENITVQVDSINGSAAGRYQLFAGEFTLEFNLPLGSCTPPSCPIDE